MKSVKAGGCSFTAIRDINDKQYCHEYVVIQCAVLPSNRIKPAIYKNLFAIVGDTSKYENNKGLFVYFMNSEFRVKVEGVDLVAKGVDME
jgi:hypothetical protein